MKKLFFVLIFFLFFVSLTSTASTLTVKGNTKVTMWGFFDSEYGLENHSTDFFKTNTTVHQTPIKGKTNFSSRAQVRLGFKFFNPNAHLSGNIAMDSWKKNGFGLIFSYVKHKISPEISITIGKDWSLVNERTLHLLSSTFRPYPAGFQGSKRHPQVRIDFNKDLGSIKPGFSFGFEYRDGKHGVTIGKNKKNNITISNSGIESSRISIPAIVCQARLHFSTNFGKPSYILAFYEVQPIYLYTNKEVKKYPYTYSIASTINYHSLSLSAQYIHTKGYTGINGISGNGLLTYSYIYKNNKLITRDSNAIGADLAFGILKHCKLIAGYTYLNVYNDNFKNAYFLKKEAKRVKSDYLMAIIAVTRVTKLFIQWSHIDTTYSTGNLDGKFTTAAGNLIWAGYRWYF